MTAPERSGGSTLDETRAFLTGLGLPARDSVELPSSPLQFPDGGHYRVEIPSVEGPAAMRTVVTEARRRRVPVHRVSQGSGIMMLTDDEIAEMVQLGQETGIEVCLFVGPRAGWDIGIQASSASGKAIAAALRGADQLVYGIEDVRRACALGLRCVLVADVGQLWVIQQMKREGHLPDDLVVKMSVSFPVANPATARVLQDLGATTVNLPVDLSIAQVAAIRAAVETPLDMYIEAPDDLASPVRYYELPELARVAAPLYMKFAVRNSPNVYPSGEHLDATVQALSRERVRRAALGLAMIERHAPALRPSPAPVLDAGEEP